MNTASSTSETRAHRYERTSPPPTLSFSRAWSTWIFTRCPGLVPRTVACSVKSPRPRQSRLCIAIRWRPTPIVPSSRPLARARASGHARARRDRRRMTVSPLGSVRRRHLRRRGRGNLRGFPRDGRECGRVGGGRPLALDFPTDSQRWAANYLEYAASRTDGP